MAKYTSLLDTKNVKAQRVTMQTNPNTVVIVAEILAINNAHTFCKEVLVARINRKMDIIEGITPAPKPGSTTRQPRANTSKNTPTTRTSTPAASVEGFVIKILGKPQKDGSIILANRKMKVIEVKGDSLIGFLIKESNGSLQASQITMEIKYTDYTKQKAQ